MLKQALPLTLLLVAGLPAPARAADCLQQLDSLVVQYDLPASEQMAGTQAGRTAANTPANTAGPDSSETLSGLRHFPAGRPGAPIAGEELALRPAPALPARNQLTAAQRKDMMSVLHDARSIEALGNEEQCLDLVKKAQAIPGKPR